MLCKGQVTYKAVAEDLGYEYVNPRLQLTKLFCNCD